jgi:hypothetical protein
LVYEVPPPQNSCCPVGRPQRPRFEALPRLPAYVILEEIFGAKISAACKESEIVAFFHIALGDPLSAFTIQADTHDKIGHT